MEKVSDLLCQRATPTTVSALFGGMTLFRVPAYQRAYEWENEQIDAFIDDVRRCWQRRINGERERHFFGSVVTSPKDPGGLVRPRREVIDGQQRFATFLLFVASLRQHCLSASELFREGSPELASALSTMAETLFSRFIMNKDLEFMETKDVYPLTLNDTDDAVFKGLLRGDDVQALAPSHRRLEAAYEACFAMLQERRDATGSPEREFNALNQFYASALEDWEVVHIEANAPEHASLIFRVLNNRGLPVSDCDLLRATTMERAGQRLEAAEKDQLAAAWKEIGGIAPNPDDYLVLAYQARTGRRFNIARTSTEFEAMHFEELASGELLGAADARALVQRVEALKTDMLKISALADGNIVGGGLNLSPVMSDRLAYTLRDLKQLWILPLVYAAQSLSADHQERLMCVLERFAFRYGVLARARIAEYDRKIGPMITRIRDTPNEYRLADLEAILRDLLDRYATTEALERQLDGLDYDKNKKELKYLLAISEFMSAWYNGQANGRPTVMAPNVSIDIRAMTLEHVSPQNPDEAGVEMLPHLHKIGNLTLLSEDENNRAGNRPFHNKRTIFQESRLQINQVLAENEEWGADQASARQEALRAQAMRIFDLNF